MLKQKAVSFQIVLNACLALAATGTLADPGALNAAVKTGSQATINLALSKQKDSALRLEVRHAALGAVLKAIADKTGAVIHYSVLPEEPVTATCVGATVKQVMECVLGARVDRVYRNMAGKSADKGHANTALQKEEIWILGTRYGDSGSSMNCTLDAGSATVDGTSKAREQDAQTALLRMAQLAEDGPMAELRKQALSMLAAGGKTGNPETDAEIAATLEDAFKNKDAEVRVQAVFGLAQQDGDNTEVLRAALQDDNSDVRLMAVESAKNDSPQGRAILTEALNDEDGTVRALAGQRLGVEADGQ
ncbi:MAG: HEAT repeat domain-containing protein [Methylovulum sp.]|nr:HEAT repeat domain-containing protein [Methylovulum sp.]